MGPSQSPCAKGIMDGLECFDTRKKALDSDVMNELERILSTNKSGMGACMHFRPGMNTGRRNVFFQFPESLF